MHYVSVQAIQRQEVRCDFRGLNLGDSWIAPVTITLSFSDTAYYAVRYYKEVNRFQNNSVRTHVHITTHYTAKSELSPTVIEPKVVYNRSNM